ncbi:MAG: SDR family NAD(P)-dependent oxidoreductase [Chthoniobacteraceae bacterium]
MNYRLSSRHPGRRAFITGAGGSLGRALAVALARDGWTLGITDLRDDALAESKQLIEQAGGRAFVYRFDVADKDAYRAAFESYIASAGGLDVLINNAGVGDGGMFGDYSLENWQWITGVNQMGVIYGTHFAVPLLKQQRSGHIISIASAGGIANLPEMSMYNVTKAAVISLMESIYAELRVSGVSVSVVCPTFFRSNVMQYHRGDARTTSLGEAIAQSARHSAPELADYVLRSAGRRAFYILYPRQAKLTFYLKHFFTRSFLFIIARLYARSDWAQRAARMRW